MKLIEILQSNSIEFSKYNNTKNKIAITASRGRGKSAALGLVASAALE